MTDQIDPTDQTKTTEVAIIASDLLPDGWTVSPFHSNETICAPHGFVTIDFERRLFRAGMGIGREMSTRQYAGRGWKRALIADAVRWLRKAGEL